MDKIHATAPCRINDIGGWTDTRFAEHGAVCSIAVYPGAEVNILLGAYNGIRVSLDNYGEVYDIEDERLRERHPFIAEALYRNTFEEDRMSITISSHMPPGASTGTSAAVVVALIGALTEAAGMPIGPVMIAHQAHDIETQLGYESGIQDQVAAAFGGISFIEIPEYPRFVHNRIEVSNETKAALSRRLSLWYLGKPHASSEIHEQVIETHDPHYLEWLRGFALGAMGLLAGVGYFSVGNDLKRYGDIMITNTSTQAQLSRDLVSADAWKVISIAQGHKAAGWKVNGAGGDGGTVTVLGSNDDRERIQMMVEIADAGFKQIPIELADEGLRVWTYGV